MQSANVVGYQNIILTNNWSFLTLTFKDVAQEKFDLTKIKFCRVNKGVIVDFSTSGMNSCKNGQMVVRRVDKGGSYLSEYHYISEITETTPTAGWYEEGTKPVVPGAVMLNNGEGLVLHNMKSNGAAAMLVSGEVDLINQTVINKDWSLSGNNTPVTIDLFDMQVKRVSNGVIVDFSSSGMNSCKAGQMVVQKVTTGGSYDDEYHFVTEVTEKTPTVGWYKNGSTHVGRGEVFFLPGEGFIIHSTKSDGGAVMVLPSPLAK